MSNNGAALLGGLLIGGLVVGAAMSAENAAERQNRRNMRAYGRQQRRVVQGSTFCICGAKMVEGRIQQGVCKCNNLNCQRVLTGQVCYYCPMGANVQQHRKGFFYCQTCAAQLRRQGNQVVNISNNPPPMQVKTVPVVQQAKPVQKRGGAYVVKQGYMSKKGNWFNTAYKKRWFKLWNNKKMAYLTHPGASYTKGYADFTKIKKMEKKGKHGMEVTTPERVWSFLCQSEQDRNDWFITIQSVCMGIKPQVMVPAQPQPQVKYVPAPQPQYAQPQQALPNNGNVPQPQYAQPYIPQAQAQPIAQPQAQPMYRGSVIQQPSNPQPPPSQLTRPQSQSLQPGMVGYNGGNMYGNNNNNNNNNNVNAINNQMNNMNINNQKWENEAPPPAYADASAPSAPPEDDIVPSAPPADDNVNEGAYTGQ